MEQWIEITLLPEMNVHIFQIWFASYLETLKTLTILKSCHKHHTIQGFLIWAWSPEGIPILKAPWLRLTR